jgi:hypothetical protein
LKPGRPRSTSEEQIAQLVNTALTTKPKGQTHWSRRTLASATGISTTTVHRYMSLFGLQPHRSKSFKLSSDPFFIEKVRDVVGLYLNPPDNALVLCVDEKSQVQALERTQPMLPMGLGYVAPAIEPDSAYKKASALSGNFPTWATSLSTVPGDAIAAEKGSSLASGDEQSAVLPPSTFSRVGRAPILGGQKLTSRPSRSDFRMT